MTKKKSGKKSAAVKTAPKCGRGGSANKSERGPAGTATKTGAGTEEAERAASKKGRPVRCIHRHTEKEFRAHFRRVCGGLIDKAAEGGVGQTRLLLDMGQFGEAKAGKRRGGGKSLSAMLLEELKRRQDEREAARDAEAAGCDGRAAGGDGEKQ